MLHSVIFPVLTLVLCAAADPQPAPQAAKPATTQAPKPAPQAAPQAPAQAPKPAPQAAAAPQEDKVLARIDGREYRVSDFQSYLEVAYNPQQRMQMDYIAGAKAEALTHFLEYRLLEAKARKEGMDKGPAYQRRMSIMEMQVLLQSLMEKEGPALMTKVAVSDEDVKAFYEQNKERFMRPENFTCRHILVELKKEKDKDAKPADGEAAEEPAKPAESKGYTEAQAQARLRKIRAALAKGRSFADLAKEYSDDEGSKANGGLYENVPFGKFHAPFEAAVRAQAPGKPGKPVKTLNGYHIILVEKINPPTPTPLEEAQDRIRQHLAGKKQEQVMKEFVEAVRKEVPYQEYKEAFPIPAAPALGIPGAQPAPAPAAKPAPAAQPAPAPAAKPAPAAQPAKPEGTGK